MIWLTLDGGGEWGTSWSIPPSQTIAMLSVTSSWYFPAMTVNQSGILMLSICCRRAVVVEETSRAILLFVLINAGIMYAIAAAWVRRDVDVFPLNMRIQDGDEVVLFIDLWLWTRTSLEVVLLIDVWLQSMTNFLLFGSRSERKPWAD